MILIKHQIFIQYLFNATTYLVLNGPEKYDAI